MSKKIAKIFFVLSLIASLVLFVTIFVNGIFPQKYRLLLLVILILFEIILFMLLKKENKVAIILIIVISSFLILINSFASYYILQGVNVIESINENQKKEEKNFSLIVLKDSSYKNIDDVKNENIKVAINQDKENIKSYENLLSKEKNIKLNIENSKTYINAAKELMAKKANVILLNEAYRSIINDQIEGFDEKTRVIDILTEEIDAKDIRKKVDKDISFNVFISGIDTYGQLSKVSRSDVNLILTINPKTGKMLITTIPRDSYVKIAGGGQNQEDKLTHAGIYGIESSVKTLENLFDIDINYYARVNFSTFMQVIDVLDGVDVYNNQAFSTEIYDFPEGTIHLDGQKALAFARERYSLKRGDLDRGLNQEKVLKAIIEKSLSPSMLLNYNSFLDIVINSTDTNMQKDKIIELINGQIDSGKTWDIQTTEVTGVGQMGLKSFAMPDANLYMHVLDEKSINDVSKKIKNTISGNE
ncbi:MAG: LCP family protein [Peptoniphilaceae bacterium]|nr:LCP family protein [Peptoniphilaceae bacterium]MDD7383707.1 LCP family protein [Peptoniphilaceae bacterium]MDY3737894.1 LCP family protein [Peptoniphilaceae bacterium]